MKFIPNFIAPGPYIAELDMSGTVVDPNGCSEFHQGDSVFGINPPELTIKTKQGALAEYVAIRSNLIIHRPPNVSPVEAAGLACVGLTALQGIDSLGLESGQTVFVYGGSSAVGAFAIQIAKARGYRVVTSASGKNETFVRSLGADEVGSSLSIY